MSKTIFVALVAAMAALAVACGGGASTSTLSSPMPVMATGTITGFGSIFVNGVHFQTSSATIRKNGAVVDQSQLAVGEIARVKGSENSDGTGVADSVDVDESVVGPIAAIDTTNSTLTVLGQMVKIDSGTSFSKDIQPADITGLKVAEVIRVSGLIDSSGTIAATRIELNGPGSPLQILGTVSSLDTTAHTFKINALVVVNYSSANVAGFTSGQPSNGDLIEAQGTMFDAATATLTATQVARVESDQEVAGDHRDLEREGLITRFASATDFDVAGKPVATTAATVYHNGTVTDLALNVKVEVDGALDSNNVLIATLVEFHHNGNIELESQASAINSMAGTLTVLGIQVTVTSTTRLEDDSSAQVQMFSLSNITAGDTIDVRGYESPAGSGKLVATRLERKPPSTTVIVQGPFTAGMSPDFTVFGVTIDASAATIMGSDESLLSLSDFLTQAVGQSVDVKGTLSGMVVKATEIRIDHHSDHGGDD